MDERAINGAAIEAIRDLELDCEIKEVRRSSGVDEWCIEFSGKYGQFCDKFQNQFGEQSSHQVIREKIKGHLIKQVNKIRSSTGRKRKPAVIETGARRAPESGILTAPLRMMGEMFDRVASITGIAINQASTVAETARDAVADAASNMNPVTIEARSRTRAVKRASGSARKKTAKAAQAKSAKTKKAARRVARNVHKQAKKARKAAGKIAVQARKAKATKKTAASKKTSRRGK
jgi:hypothetical protein